MNKVVLLLVIGFALSLIGVGGDLLIKEATLHPALSGWKWLALGALVYASTAVGWFYMMRHEELSVIGIIYSLTTAIALFVFGAFFYKEKITGVEAVGMLMAMSSLIILYRFG